MTETQVQPPVASPQLVTDTQVLPVTVVSTQPPQSPQYGQPILQYVHQTDYVPVQMGSAPSSSPVIVNS
jgi:hypothetical protein